MPGLRLNNFVEDNVGYVSQSWASIGIEKWVGQNLIVSSLGLRGEFLIAA